MQKKNYLFTSESVSDGHPDKVCDQISDSILDAILAQDAHARVACESLVTTNTICVAGEVTTTAKVDYEQIARQTVREIGYNNKDYGFDADSCEVILKVGQQSPDISQGVTAGQGLFQEQGAGDQGMMFGYACNETSEYMPTTIHYSHKILQKLSELRKQKAVDYLRPDSKSQITAEYVNGELKRIDTVVLSTQHDEKVSQDTLKDFVINECVKKVLPQELMDSKTRYFINPTGRFVVGGPHGDCGLTGRKIIVDTYGGHGAHGGGAFSGKDPSKVDRSAAYAARYMAKHIVAAGAAEKCLVQLAYAIGVAEPVSICVETYGTGTLSDEKLANLMREIFPIKPKDIITQLNLLRPIYKATSVFGHFGRKEFPWEQLDKLDRLKAAL